MIAALRRHPAAGYFALAFVLSWGGVLAAALPGSIPAHPAEAERLFVFVYLAMLTGPPIAGLVFTAVTGGVQGVRAMLQRLLAWRVSPLWYAVALLTAPLVLSFVLLGLTQLSADYSPAILLSSGDTAGPVSAQGRASLVAIGLLVGAGAGFFEELGWTGFALPTLRKTHGVFYSGVVIGLFWGAWHFLASLWGSATSLGSLSMPIYVLATLFTFLPPYRVLMAWVYDRSRSLLIAMLMHASLTSSMIILGPNVAGQQMLLYNIAFAGTLWVVVGIIAMSGRGGSGSGRD